MIAQEYFHADLYSHCFVLTKASPRGQQIIRLFGEQYIQYGMELVNRRYQRVQLRIFAQKVYGGIEFRFHIQQWAPFVKFLGDNGIYPDTYVVKHNPPPVPVKIDLQTLPQWQVRDYQEPIIEYLTNPLPNRIKLVEIQTGKGKLQPLDAKIKVPGGWSTMGEMYVGKEVTAITGTTQIVTGVFPNGVQQQYRVTFADGRSTECGAEHLWTVYYINTTPHKRWRVVNTLEVLRLISMPNPRVYIPLIESELSPGKLLLIDPYLLGVILGDGGISQHGVNVTKGDQQLFDILEAHLPEGIQLIRRDHKTQALVRTEDASSHVLRTALKELGLMGKRSWEKFIPEDYLHGSHQQRLALLQGLMDTDGTANTIATGGATSYCSTSKQLAEQMQYLVRSLGGIASISVRQTYFTYEGVKKPGRIAYDVNIRMKKPSELFRLEAKKSRTNDDNQYAKDLKLRVVSVEPTRMAECQCISVSSPEQLYITDDFIVTHNTFSAMKAASLLGLRVCVVLKPAFMDKWQADVKNLCGIEGDDLEVIQGTPQLMKLINKALKGKLRAKIIIISSRTMQRWFKSYEEGYDRSLAEGYGCRPGDFYQTIGAGLRLIDEVHLDFHLNFKIDLYTNIEWSTSLSATLKCDDGFLNRMYEVAYPKPERFAGLPYDRYIHAFAWFYRFKNPILIRTTERGGSTYSQHAVEKSIIKFRRIQDDYFAMINRIIREFFFMKYVKGDRLLIYCGSIELCAQLVSFLRNIHPTFDIRRYCEEDPYENLMEAEISVSTLLSAGTGHDIAGLTTVILTNSVKATQSNIQGFGRLRNLAGKELKFVYLVCQDIPKQMAYHETKRDLLQTMALSYSIRNNSNDLG